MPRPRVHVPVRLDRHADALDQEHLAPRRMLRHHRSLPQDDHHGAVGTRTRPWEHANTAVWAGGRRRAYRSNEPRRNPFATCLHRHYYRHRHRHRHRHHYRRYCCLRHRNCQSRHSSPPKSPQLAATVAAVRRHSRRSGFLKLALCRKELGHMSTSLSMCGLDWVGLRNTGGSSLSGRMLSGNAVQLFYRAGPELFFGAARPSACV
mmetsp:Transcript_12497/g.27036  ORF Transcript_12497/g.27036 Transcript_12497/m.27036 type:complete len:206 (+) Transcript_12497:1029-1646(+)